MKVKLGLIDDSGDVVNDLFDSLPAELADRDLKDKGNFVENAQKIDLGSPDRGVTIEKFIITTGPGFFESCPTAQLGGGSVVLESDDSLVLDPGSLEIERELL